MRRMYTFYVNSLNEIQLYQRKVWPEKFENVKKSTCAIVFRISRLLTDKLLTGKTKLYNAT